MSPVPDGIQTLVYLLQLGSSMSSWDGGHRETAIAAVADRDYQRAGDQYTRAGWRALSDPDPDRNADPFAVEKHGWVGRGLAQLVLASLSYRVAEYDSRSTRRAVAGIATTRDIAAGITHPAQRACLLEFVGDFRVVAGLDGAVDAYETATAAYTDASAEITTPQEWSTTPLFDAAAAPLKQAARGPANGEIAVTWDDLHGDDPADAGAFLGARPRYKRQRFPQIVSRLIDNNYLAAPRGSTEYNTTHHRCPSCGSTDVNWVGDQALCLRCSAPTDPQ